MEDSLRTNNKDNNLSYPRMETSCVFNIDKVFLGFYYKDFIQAHATFNYSRSIFISPQY